MFTATAKNSINLLREISRGTGLGDAIKGMVDTLDDYANGRSNPYDYEVTVKVVTVLNNLHSVIYDYAVKHYGKEYVTPTDDSIYVDANETYEYLMRDVCF